MPAVLKLGQGDATNQHRPASDNQSSARGNEGNARRGFNIGIIEALIHIKEHSKQSTKQIGI